MIFTNFYVFSDNDDGFKSETSGSSVRKFDGDCDFDKDFCGYLPKSDSVVRWTGKAPANKPLGLSSGPGTEGDHTNGSGHYALFDGDKLVSYTSEASLNKTFTNNNLQLDYTFWYYLWGSSVGSLTLFKNDEVIWLETKQDENMFKGWKKASVKFPVGNFTVSQFFV